VYVLVTTMSYNVGLKCTQRVDVRPRIVAPHSLVLKSPLLMGSQRIRSDLVTNPLHDVYAGKPSHRVYSSSHRQLKNKVRKYLWVLIFDLMVTVSQA